MIYILGLLAKAGHGKSTVAAHLQATRNAEVRSLAGPLKRAAQRVFGFSTEQLWGSQAEKEAIDPRYGFSARWLLQRLGTEGLRAEFDEDIHARALLRGLRQEHRAEGPPRLVVVDDVRFPNDARFIAQGGPDFRGAVLKVVCADASLETRAAHASEDAIDMVDSADIALTVSSSRGLGLGHLFGCVDQALENVAFEGLRPALRP